MIRNGATALNPSVLVTGASGFIGSHLIEQLLNEGYRVVSLVLPGETTRRLVDMGAEVVMGDVSDKRSLARAVHGVDIVYHLAGVIVADDAEAFYQVNVQGTRNLVEACTEAGGSLKRFVFVSSISAFGPTAGETFDEDSPCRPINDYGKSKLLAEEFLRSERNPFPYTIVRPVQVYGPRTWNAFYEISKIARYGLQIDFEGDITVGFVEDIARGVILASTSPKAVNETYLLGENRIYSVSEVTTEFSKAVRKRRIRLRLPFRFLYGAAYLVEVIAGLMKSKPPISRWLLDSYVKDCFWRFDVSKAEDHFGFRAATSLAEGAKITVDWYRKEGYL